ncbi:MAG: hypothetical protein ACI8RP_000207 [Urechidicola sp.]|jgi:hypothetical protein
MILNAGCDPKINVVYIGSEILKLLISESFDLHNLIIKSTNTLDISIDHVILSLDWLFIVKAISINNDKVILNETK